jgi:hypothetical protein
VAKKRILWRKSAFCGEKVKNASEKKYIMPLVWLFSPAWDAVTLIHLPFRGH